MTPCLVCKVLAVGVQSPQTPPPDTHVAPPQEQPASIELFGHLLIVPFAVEDLY